MERGMKLVHLADVHLGRRARQLGDFGRTLRAEIERALARVFELGAREGAQAILVAGDLFDSRPTKKRVRWLFAAVKDLQVPFIVLPGTHGHDRSAYESAFFARPPSNFHVLRGSGCKLFDPPGFYLSYNVERPLDLPSPPDGFPAVGVAHGSVDVPSDEAEVFSSSDVANSGVRYLALGHWHGTKDVSAGGVVAWYAGPPEALEWKGPEGAKGAALLVDLADHVNVKRLEVGRYRWHDLELDVETTDEKGLKEELLRYEGGDHVVRAGLRGGGADLARTLREELAVRFAFLLLEAHPQESSPVADFLVGEVGWHFVQLMKEKIASAGEEEKPVLSEALALGKDLLAGEKDMEDLS